jgi:cellulose synthase/poly-beta-1,6-N-acetylglucosamine synthase-like glycosyltransferase
MNDGLPQVRLRRLSRVIMPISYALACAIVAVVAFTLWEARQDAWAEAVRYGRSITQVLRNDIARNIELYDETLYREWRRSARSGARLALLMIRTKLENLAALDYPADRVTAVIACDGCTDGTGQIAAETIAGAACAGRKMELLDFLANRGKVAVLNEAIASRSAEIIALSDVSATVEPDALRRAVAYFADPRVGFVCPTFC